MKVEMYFAVKVAVEEAFSWSITSRRDDAWREELGASDFSVRAMLFGIWDMPALPFTVGFVID